MWPRLIFLTLCTLVIAVAQFQRAGLPGLHAQLELVTEPNMPVRVQLFKNDRPFRLAPVDAILPIKVDLFYRDTMWRANPDPRTLEVTFHDQSYFLLLKGSATFQLPPGDYRVEATRGLLYTPVSQSFSLQPGKSARIPLRLTKWTPPGQDWISADDHIHLTRGPEDNAAYLGWLQAEDLSVGNFLQLQRQMDAAPQYAFGPSGEAKSGGYSIRSGQESRSEYYGHINLLGGRQLIRPVSVGTMYANEPGAYPFPSVLFDQGKAQGALRGFAHFHGSMPHSTLLMDLALGNLDFLEVFQFGKLWTDEWYELLNAGFRVTGLAGSDFPVPLGRTVPWPKYLPLLGPERAMAQARPGESAYESWAAAVRRGDILVTNGPVIDFTLKGGKARAQAHFFRPIEQLEIIRNGVVIASLKGDGKSAISLETPVDAASGSAWYAARVRARKEEGEPVMQAHTNPIYLLKDSQPVRAGNARQNLASRWAAELDYYRSANLPFRSDAERQEFFTRAGQALSILRK